MLFWLALLALIFLAVLAFRGYNKLRMYSESVREMMSNIGVTSKKRVSLINQLIEVVKGYQESEKLVMLKVSEDVTSAAQAAMVYQQSSVALSTANNLAQKFPDLKANQQYNRLIDSIQNCEMELENARQRYNAAVRIYNISRSSIPEVFYSSILGFRPAPYLEFTGGDDASHIEDMASFVSDDGERLNMLLGQAGSGLVRIGGKVVDNGIALAGAAQNKLRQIARDVRKNQEKSGDASLAESKVDDSVNDGANAADSENRVVCNQCGHVTEPGAAFCASCGHSLHAN